MTDLSLTISPKSDQLTSDDLLVGPLTIRVTKVTADMSSRDQPISIYFDGDGGKPYKPCLSMRRVLVYAWGDKGDQYPGRSMTLYRDPDVKWGGLSVGGIRISHMSHINQTMTLALTVTRGSKKVHQVQPLVQEKAPSKGSIKTWLDNLELELGSASPDMITAILARDEVRKAPASLRNGALERMNAIVQAAHKRITANEPPPTDDPPMDEEPPAEPPTDVEYA